MRSSGILFLSCLLLVVPHVNCWNDAEAVLLRDVQALTLYRGRYTTARRSSPVLQLQCVGGSAGCSAFVPEVVQCYNRGSDGIDTQWECKADMDNSYRFGRIEVTCEGYSSPNDAYVLRGSCGLEYTLELTAEGRQQHGSWGSAGFSDFASSFFQGFSNQKQQERGNPYQSNSHYESNSPSGDGVGGLIVVAFLLLVAYAVYKMFLCNPTHGHQGFAGDSGAQGYDGAQGYGGAWDNSQGTGPPPPGFKPDYYSADHSSPNPGYGFSDAYTRPQSSGTGFTGGNQAAGGGFWTGMGTGGILGYLFGNQRRQSPMSFTRSSYSSRPRSTPKTSSGTRTASGFGGTKRR